MTKRRQFAAAFKAEVAREYRVKPEIIARGRPHFLENAAGVFEKSRAANGEAEARIAELERVLGQKTLELEVAKSLAGLPVVERRLMAEMGLKVRSRRSGPRFPNLVRNLVEVRPDQVCGADIAYIRLAKGFAYLDSWTSSPTSSVARRSNATLTAA